MLKLRFLGLYISETRLAFSNLFLNSQQKENKKISNLEKQQMSTTMTENILSPESLGSAHPRRVTNDHSLLGAVERLASNVEIMEDAVMVPSRLMGLNSEHVRTAVSNDQHNTKSIDHGTDLYMYFNMLKSLKSELVRGSSPFQSSHHQSSASLSPTSSGSSSSSTEDSEDEGECQERNMETKQTIDLFRMHLKGLVNIMNQLSNSSQIITKTYQKSIDDERNEQTSTGSR